MCCAFFAFSCWSSFRLFPSGCIPFESLGRLLVSSLPSGTMQSSRPALDGNAGAEPNGSKAATQVRGEGRGTSQGGGGDDAVSVCTSLRTPADPKFEGKAIVRSDIQCVCRVCTQARARTLACLNPSCASAPFVKEYLEGVIIGRFF